MAIEMTLPRQGWSMDEAAFVGWLKQDGETVKAGEPLFAVETDKAVQEIESLDGGILRLTPNSPKEGDTVRVADVLGYLVAPGEATPAGAPAQQPAAKTESGAVPPPVSKSASAAAAPVSGVPSVPAGRPVSPRTAKRAIQEGVDLRTVRRHRAGRTYSGARRPRGRERWRGRARGTTGVRGTSCAADSRP